MEKDSIWWNGRQIRIFTEHKYLAVCLKMESLYVHCTHQAIAQQYNASHTGDLFGKRRKIKTKQKKIVSNNFPLLQFKCTNGCNVPAN